MKQNLMPVAPLSDNPSRIKVLCFAQGDRQTASSRERLFKLLPLLQERGIDALVPPVTRSISARTALSDLSLALLADVVLIQKRLMLPPYLALLKRVRPIIFDFDDALYTGWPRSDSVPSRAVVELNRYRLIETLKHASLAVAGSHELESFAQRYCRTVRVIPTSVGRFETTKQHSDTQDVTIGWTGTHGNLAYLDRMPTILQRLNERLAGTARMKVVCSRPLGRDIPYVDFKPWSLEDEESDLLGFDIGIMPLPDTEWARGKCGFKLLQYGSVGLPVVASPVGANSVVVREGQTGYLTDSDDEWVGCLEDLATNAELRQRIGRAGREHVRCNYSPEASADLLADAIRSVARVGGRGSRRTVG